MAELSVNNMMEAAIRYAELGYRVFPCAAEANPVPLTRHGFKDATGDREQIERWWTRYPCACIGIAASGLLVVDIDAPPNPWLADESDLATDLIAAPTSITPSGGRHHIFRRPAGKSWSCTVGQLAPRVDTRTDGGYIVVPPSIRPDGSYRWLEGCDLDVGPDQLPKPPAWLIERLDALAVSSPRSPQVASSPLAANEIPSGHRNATLARLAGAMRRVGMGQAEIAAALLRTNADRCSPPLEPKEVERIAANIARYEPDQIAVAMAENHWDQMYADERPDESDDYPDPGPIPETLLSVPGFIADVIDYTLSTAPYPEPVLAFGAALALQAFLAGRKVRDESDNRTNLYILGLANSGAGKDYPRKVNQKILLQAGLSECLGDTFASGEGIEDRLFAKPAVLFQTDEIDGLMTKINHAKDARHEGIMNVLLKMYSSSNSIYPMRVKAGKEPGVIDQPSLCIFGTAIPKHYYDALSLKMLTNGFFARMLVFEAGPRSRGRDAVKRAPPKRVLETTRWWAKFNPGKQAGNLQTWHPTPTLIEHAPDAREDLREFRAYADDRYAAAEENDDTVAMAIWARAGEKAQRLALIYACSENHEQPLISSEAARWAASIVDHQTRRMLFKAAEHVSETEFHAKCKKLVAVLRQWRDRNGDEWMPFWQLNRRLPWSDREHEEIRTTLLNQRAIEYSERRTGGTPQRLYRVN